VQVAGSRYYSPGLGRMFSRANTGVTPRGGLDDGNPRFLLPPYAASASYPGAQERPRSATVATWKCGLDKPVGDPGTYDYSGIPDWFPQEAKDCIKAHEQAHASHDMPCCDKARAAYQAPGADKAKVMADCGFRRMVNTDSSDGER
jgi:hypothetical protein